MQFALVFNSFIRKISTTPNIHYTVCNANSKCLHRSPLFLILIKAVASRCTLRTTGKNLSAKCAWCILTTAFCYLITLFCPSICNFPVWHVDPQRNSGVVAKPKSSHWKRSSGGFQSWNPATSLQLTPIDPEMSINASRSRSNWRLLYCVRIKGDEIRARRTTKISFIKTMRAVIFRIVDSYKYLQ
jgi:hypothetical protein